MRPQSYEDKAEAEFLVSLFPGREGLLENTVFCVLGPDGKQRLTKSGRSPSQQFKDATAFASFLGQAFEPYAKEAKDLARLPVHRELALALNVGACDLMPVAILVAQDDKAMQALEKTVAAQAWSAEHIGRQHYVRVVGAQAIAAAKTTHGLELKPGLNLVEPDAFGQTAKLLGHLDANLTKRKFSEGLVKARGDHDPATKLRRDHIREARQRGIKWESELPVTDSKARRVHGDD